VLVVDDDMAIRHLVVDALGAQGYTVVAAASAGEAVSAAANVARVDLLLADVVTNGSTGPTLVPQLRQRSPEMRVLYMTAHAADDMARRGVAQGDVVLLEKPFTLGTLAEHVRRVLDA
jgi:two-component system, cell cycle sensor histidine kinase and response regulator CckA